MTADLRNRDGVVERQGLTLLHLSVGASMPSQIGSRARSRGGRTYAERVVSVAIMPVQGTHDVWPRMRAVVKAVVGGLASGRFIEGTLDTLCTSMRASSASMMLGPRPTGKVIHSSPLLGETGSLSQRRHASEALSQVIRTRKTIRGSDLQHGAYAGLPLWSTPETGASNRRLMGALYVGFSKREFVDEAALDFLRTVAELLGGAISQQTSIDETRENLRVEKARASGDQPLALDEILAPESMAKIREEVHAAIRGQGAIMILGESGTGKTHLARAIARATKAEPVVRATLGLSDDLNTITSELFGHERGAFSGAVSKRKGLVEHAHGGTLILDEVLNLRPQAQQLLLDFTQFGTYRPLGYQGEQPKKASLRLISVTNGDIAQAVQDTRFRQDLYFRLATVPLVLPPLRERRWDIPDIALRYLRRTDPGRPWRLSEEAHHRLTNPDLRWSGNIRELEAVIERARNRCLVNEDVDPVLDPGHLDLGDGQQGLSILPRPAPNPSAPAREGGGVRERWDDLLERRASLESTEKEIIAETLEMCEGVVARAARQLSVSRTGLISRIASLGIVVPKKRSGGQR